MAAAFPNTPLPRFSDGRRNSEHNNRERIRDNMALTTCSRDGNTTPEAQRLGRLTYWRRQKKYDLRNARTPCPPARRASSSSMVAVRLRQVPQHLALTRPLDY
jgi:hypothetical protein